MKPSTILFCAALVAACASTGEPSPRDAARLDEARRLLADQPLQALDVAEALLKDNPGWRDARLVAAEGSLRLARNGGSQTQLHLIDAATQFDKALYGVDD
ncbi:MAG: hypothetical protein WBO45_17950, partial [Planctomycetota bacterium]